MSRSFYNKLAELAREDSSQTTYLVHICQTIRLLKWQVMSVINDSPRTAVLFELPGGIGRLHQILLTTNILMTLNSEIAWWCECLAYLPPNDLNYILECETTAQTFTGTLKEIRFEEMMDHYFVKNLWIYFVTAESGQFWPNPADSGWVRLNLVESGWIWLSPAESGWVWLSPAESGWVRLSPGWVRGESGWVRVSPGESGWVLTESIIYK